MLHIIVGQSSLIDNATHNNSQSSLINNATHNNSQSSLIDNATHNNSQSGMIDLLKIDVSHLPAGVYFIRIGNKVEKFVKM